MGILRSAGMVGVSKRAGRVLNAAKNPRAAYGAASAFAKKNPRQAALYAGLGGIGMYGMSRSRSNGMAASSRSQNSRYLRQVRNHQSSALQGLMPRSSGGFTI